MDGIDRHRDRGVSLRCTRVAGTATSGNQRQRQEKHESGTFFGLFAPEQQKASKRQQNPVDLTPQPNPSALSSKKVAAQNIQGWKVSALQLCPLNHKPDTGDQQESKQQRQRGEVKSSTDFGRLSSRQHKTRRHQSTQEESGEAE